MISRVPLCGSRAAARKETKMESFIFGFLRSKGKQKKGKSYKLGTISKVIKAACSMRRRKMD